jgi:hypothetical protein
VHKKKNVRRDVQRKATQKLFFFFLLQQEMTSSVHQANERPKHYRGRKLERHGKYPTTDNPRRTTVLTS